MQLINNKWLLDSGPSPESLHKVEDFLRCPQLYAHKWIRGIKWPPRHPLTRGSLLHIGLAHLHARHWARQQGCDPDIFYDPFAAIDLVATQRREEWGTLADEYRPICQRAVAAYSTSYLPEFTENRYRILHVERVFRVELVVHNRREVVSVRVLADGEAPQPADPTRGIEVFTYTQRPDLCWIDDRNQIYIVDHKGTAKVAAQVLRRYTLSTQMLGYRLLGQQLWGERFGGIIINTISLHEDKGNAVFKFRRSAPEPAPLAVLNFPRRVVEAKREMAALVEEKRDLLDYPQAFSEQICWTAYGACDAFDMCRWGATTPPVSAHNVDFVISIGKP